MWIFTTVGFFSVVANERPEGGLLVRSRSRKDIDALVAELRAFYAAPELVREHEVIETPRADYPFRIVVDREDFGDWVAQHAEDIDYTNFKGRVEEVQGRAREQLYERVWGVMRSDQERAEQAEWEEGFAP